jgi:hypothetical protein
VSKLNPGRVFFPWERTGGFVRRLGLHRARPFLWVVVAVTLVVVIGLREREAAGKRRTRAILRDVSAALDRYLAEHDGQCPRRFAQLAPYAGFTDVPRDAWGSPLRLTCPSPQGGLAYLLSSDGPDRRPGGLDRIE